MQNVFLRDMRDEVIGDVKKGVSHSPQKAPEWLRERVPGRISGEQRVEGQDLIQPKQVDHDQITVGGYFCPTTTE